MDSRHASQKCVSGGGLASLAVPSRLPTCRSPTASHCCLQVHTNPAEFREGALRMRPFHEHPHGCHRCPSNLCKGQVSQRMAPCAALRL